MKFDFENFEFKEAPKEKVNYWTLPIYLFGWIALKSMFVVPFLLGYYLFGRSPFALVFGLILLVVIWYVFYRITER